MKDISKFDNLSKDKRIKNIIKRVSDKHFFVFSYMEKSVIYKELNDILNEKFGHKINLYINKYKTEYNNFIEVNNGAIVLNGLDNNPYIYIRDIILNHVIYNKIDDDFKMIGNIYYCSNYLSTDYDILKHSKNNSELLLMTNSLIRSMIEEYSNEYKDEYELSLDSNISKEAREQLEIANKVLDEYYKSGTYDELNRIIEVFTSMGQKEYLSKEELALLSLDEILRENIYTINQQEDKNAVFFFKHLKQFVDVFYPEYSKWIHLSYNNKSIIINNRVVKENNLFIDILMQEIEKIENVKNIARELITDEQLAIFNDNKYSYNKLDLYLYYKLSNLDRYLKGNNDLKIINYPEWKKVYYNKDEIGIFRDYNSFEGLINNNQFIKTIEKYVKTNNKNHDALYSVMKMLNDAYSSDFNLIIDRNYQQSDKFGESDEKNIYLYVEACNDKISIIATIFHEFRHLIQHREVENSNNIYDKKGYKYIMMNIMGDEVNRRYISSTDTSGYVNKYHYAYQPVEYDAEIFSQNLLRAVVNEFANPIDIDYEKYFSDTMMDNKYIDMDKYSIRLYKNYMDINKIDDYIKKDKEAYNKIIKKIDDMETYDDALEIVKLPYFSLISTEDKVSVYKVLCGNLVNLDYKEDEGLLYINNRSFQIEEMNHYEVIEAMLMIEAIEKVKNKEISFKDINKYIYNESRRYKIDEVNCFNVYAVYNYYRCFDKYLWLVNKDKQKVKCKSK